MTSTTAIPAPTSIPAPTVLGPVGRAVGAATLVLGPLCFAAAESLTQQGTDDPNRILDTLAAHHGATAASILLSVVSAAFLIWGLFAVAGRRLTRGRLLVPVGLALALWAMLANTLLLGVNVAFLAMSDPTLDRGAMVTAVNTVQHSPLGPVALTGHFVLVIAFLVLGIGFWRAGIGPRWAAALVALCGVVDATEDLWGSAGHVLVGIVISDGMMTAGFAAIAWFLLRQTDPTTHAHTDINPRALSNAAPATMG